jgi:hypothetical protein
MSRTLRNPRDECLSSIPMSGVDDSRSTSCSSVDLGRHYSKTAMRTMQTNKTNFSYEHAAGMPLLPSKTESVTSIDDSSVDDSLHREDLSFDKLSNFYEDDDISCDSEIETESRHRSMVLDVSSCYSLIAEKNAEAMRIEVSRLLSSQNCYNNPEDTATGSCEEGYMKMIQSPPIKNLSMDDVSYEPIEHPNNRSFTPDSSIYKRPPPRPSQALPLAQHKTQNIYRRKSSGSLFLPSQLNPRTRDTVLHRPRDLKCRSERETTVDNIPSNVMPYESSKPQESRWSNIPRILVLYSVIMTALASLTAYAYISLKFSQMKPEACTYTINIEMPSSGPTSLWSQIESDGSSKPVIVNTYSSMKNHRIVMGKQRK